MTHWEELLAEVRRLRSERDRRDADLYASRIALDRARAGLGGVRRRETTLPPDAARIHRLTRRIADLDARSHQRGAPLAAARAREHAARDVHEGLRQQIRALDAEVAAVEAEPPPQSSGSASDDKRVADYRRRLEALRARRRQLPEARRRAEAHLRDLERETASVEEEVSPAQAELREEARRLQDELRAALRSGDPGTPADLDALIETYKTAATSLLNSRVALETAIAAALPAHPRDVIGNLDDRVPFLLLPLRIETRFVAVDGATELWIRIYPDDIAVHTHETTLTAREVAGGEKYWTELWSAGPPDEAPAETKKKIWGSLADAFGPPRAAWVARQTRPTNWDTRPRIGQPAFPVHDLTKTSAWSRAPRTTILPDRFVVLLYQGESVSEHLGNQIPDELIVGPDPLDEEGSFVTKDGALVFGSEFSWASDFDEAVKLGMGLRIPLSPGQVAAGFEKILVLGVSVSMAPTDGQAAVERLIENHHYSPKGFAIVRQGTATNNTDDGSAGFSATDPPHDASEAIETGAPLFTADDDTDGRALADALGIDYRPLQYIANADATDRREAIMMNTALYAGTLGFYTGTMMDPVFSEAAQSSLRQFVAGRVTGRGPLPAIRVGNQPYGVLLTSDFAKWQWSSAEIGKSQFLPGLLAVLHACHALWLQRLKDVPYIGKPGASDPSAILVDVLGLHSGSVTFNQRTAFSTDYLRNLDAFQFGGRYFDDLRKNYTSKNVVLDFLGTLGYSERDAAGNLKVPQLLRLVFQHVHTTLDPANLIDGVPLSETHPVRFYDETRQKNYLHWLREAGSVDVLERQDFGANRTPPTTLLYLMLRRSLLLELHRSSVGWLLSKEVDLRATLAPTNVYNVRPEPTVSKWEAMRTELGVAMPQHPLNTKAIGDHLLTSGKDEDAAAVLTDVRAALGTLASLPTARLERLLTEHIDLCTYRLDSWQTGMFDVRLRRQRELRGVERRKGIHLGAFGWVEGLKPASRTRLGAEAVPERLRPPAAAPVYEDPDGGGFMHAPSLTQASAAALLRSGYLSHAHSGQPDLMSVNLTSERVRRALFILQGIRNGQPLEALLGYQFERALHDAASADRQQIRLNEYIHDIRDAFPFEQHYVPQRGTGESLVAIPAGNVTNGVTLAETSRSFPYGATGGVQTASAAERATIAGAKDRLKDTLDAVKDLLLCEGAYQMVQGNVDRAGAVMTALKDTTIPPDFDVINTPRGSQLSFTNRLAVQFAILDPDAATSNPWDPIPMTPRALMEPGLNQWLGALLGLPSSIRCRIAHLDADGSELGSETVGADALALQPIDLVYITGTELNTGAPAAGGESRTAASELEARLAWYYRGEKGLTDETPVRIEFLKPAGATTLGKLLVLMRTLRSLITDSRPLHALDFDPPSKQSLADAANPEGYELIGLPERVQRAVGTCHDLRLALDGIAIDAVVVEAGVETHQLTLGAAFAALSARKLTFRDIAFTIEDADVALLQTLLRSLATLGLPDAFPAAQSLTAGGSRAMLLDQAMSMSRQATAMVGRANAAIVSATAAAATAEKIRLLVDAAKAIFGDVFNVLPRFRYNNESDIQLAHADEAQLLAHAKTALEMPYPAEEWLQNVSHVRPRAARWEAVLSLHEAARGARLGLAPIQLPYRAMDSWLAVEFPANDLLDPAKTFTIAHDTLAVTLHGEASFAPASPHCGLLVDDWTELIPATGEITGVAFNYDQPNAAPPQSLLLAVTPAETGQWSWDTLVSVVNDTLLRSKLRAIDPHLLDAADSSAMAVLVPAVLADFSHVDLNIALDFRTTLAEVQPVTVITPAAIS